MLRNASEMRLSSPARSQNRVAWGQRRDVGLGSARSEGGLGEAAGERHPVKGAVEHGEHVVGRRQPEGVASGRHQGDVAEVLVGVGNQVPENGEPAEVGRILRGELALLLYPPGCLEVIELVVDGSELVRDMGGLGL